MTSRMHVTTNPELRPAQPSDEPLLFKLYASTRLEELSRLPVSAEQLESILKMQFNAQQSGYAAQHPLADHQIILFEAQEIGRILLDRSEDRFQLVDIALLPQFRGRGIGSLLLKKLQEEAAREGKKIGLFVYQTNPAKRLYERLGFSQVETDGLYTEMLWRAEEP
jgi:ribosomal protein S18 acetylase RimI-like enzyme